MWERFHGASLDAISVGGEAIFRRGMGPLLPGTEHVPPPALARRFFGDDARAPERLADYIDYVLEIEGDVGAIVAEPMRWTTVEPPPPGFWPRVRASCDRNGTLLIFDEMPSSRPHRHDVRLRADRLPRPTSWCSARGSAAA